MKKLIQFLKRSYRLTYSIEKQEAFLWEELKQLFLKEEWKSGFYEKDKIIDTVFQITENQGANFHYYIEEGQFICGVNTLNDFPIELTSDLFILASHFNNLLINGSVVVNVNNKNVAYVTKKDLLIPVLYPDELHQLVTRHYNTSCDIYKAFFRLVSEGEAPAIIIADLLKEKNNEE